MAKFKMGCKPPADLFRRATLSADRHGRRYDAPRDLPAAYDGRALNLVPPVKDQGQCGDCWDFSGVAACEIATVAAGKGTAAAVNFSEQSVLDCGSNGGCNGDWPETALEQAKNSGLADAAQYPYDGGPTGRCRTVAHVNRIDDYGYIGAQDGVPAVPAIKSAILAHGSVSCAVAADDAFQNYSGGVFAGTGSDEINHAIVLVGWQDDATVPGGGYWILRNSWGTAWGERGYMRIAYGANQVGYGAMWASVDGTTPPTPPGPTPPPPTPAPLTLTGFTAPTTVGVPVQIGFRATTIQVPIPALPVTVSSAARAEFGAERTVPNLPFNGFFLRLLEQYGPKVAAAVLADLAAGKSWEQILADVLAQFAPPAAKPHALGFSWANLLAVLEQFGAKVLPVVAADLAAGKSWEQILADVAAALQPAPTARRAPCNCR
jgi:hypothetical protein